MASRPRRIRVTKSDALAGRAPRQPAARRDDSLAGAGLSGKLVPGFAPYIAFAVLMRLSVSLALWVAFAAAFSLALPAFLHTRVLKTLDAGCIVLFALLALFAGFIPPVMTLGAMRLLVDGGMAVIMLSSFALRQPFTLQYAKEEAPRERASDPVFMRLHARVSAVWAAAFVATSIADAGAVFVSGFSDTAAVALGLAALAAALTFTLQYPAQLHRRGRAGPP